MPGVLRLVGTIVGAFVPRNSRSSNRGGVKMKIKTEGVLLNFFPEGWTPFRIYYILILYTALSSQLIIDLMERISYQRKVTALTSSSCGRAVNGKVLQINMARINPRP